MNWYRLAARNDIEIQANYLSNIIFNIFKYKLETDAMKFEDEQFCINIPINKINIQATLCVNIKNNYYKKIFVTGSFSSELNNIIIDINVPKYLYEYNFKNNIKVLYNDISFQIKNIIRHELEHYKQNPLTDNPEYFLKYDGNSIDYLIYYLSDKREIEAFVSGIYFEAKKRHIQFKEMFNIWWDRFIPVLTSNNKSLQMLNNYKNDIYNEYANYAKKRFVI